MKQKYEFDEPVMYTTGAFIQPIRLINENGSEKWFWVVSEFIDDTFFEGDVANPKEDGITKDELLATA
jgi:hypothetical protein